MAGQIEVSGKTNRSPGGVFKGDQFFNAGRGDRWFWSLFFQKPIKKEPDFIKALSRVGRDT